MTVSENLIIQSGQTELGPFGQIREVIKLADTPANMPKVVIVVAIGRVQEHLHHTLQMPVLEVSHRLHLVYDPKASQLQFYYI